MPNLVIVTSSTIDKNSKIDSKLKKKLENKLEIFEIFVNFEFYFEFFVTSSFLSMVDEVTITHTNGKD